MDHSPFNVLSLCSGGGGLDLGIRMAMPDARTACYVEREVYPLAVLAARMQDQLLDAAPCWTDLTTFDGKPWRGVVDCLAGGYPCQPFSAAGKRLGEGDPRHLWPHIARIIGEVQPEWCFFENVRGHLSLGFEQVWGDLRGLGYEVEAGLFSAAEVGAPHKRERLYILAHAACQSQREPNHETHTFSGEWAARQVSRRRGTALLADSGGTGLEEREGVSGDTDEECTASKRGRAGAGRRQVEPGVGLFTPRLPAKLGKSGLGEGYGGKAKTNAGEVLPSMWIKTREEEVQRDAGGLVTFQEKAVLQRDLLRIAPPSRRPDSRCVEEEVSSTSGNVLSDLWSNRECMSSPRGLESRQQRLDQSNDAVRFLSHAVALGAWEDVTEVCTLSNLRAALKRLQLVPETLPEIQEAWRSLPCWHQGWVAAITLGVEPWPAGPGDFQYEWEAPRITTDCPNRADRLKLLGNAVVPQTAALAWRTLYPRLAQ